MIPKFFQLLFESNIRDWQIYVILLIINAIIYWLFQNSIMTNEVYHAIFSHRYEEIRIDLQLEIIRKYQSWGYLLQPVTLALKFSLITLVIQLAVLLMGVQVNFKRLLRLVMYSSSAMILGNITRLVWILSFPINQLNQRIFNIMPFSLASLVDFSLYPIPALITLSNLNLFEIIWIFLIYKGLDFLTQDDIKRLDTIIIVLGVWTFLFVLQYMLTMFLNKILEVY